MLLYLIWERVTIDAGILSSNAKKVGEPDTMRLSRYSDGQSVVLDTSTPLGKGGEARVFKVRSAPSLVAKMYHEPTPEQIQKLHVMLANPPEDPTRASGHLSIAFPTDLLTLPSDKQKVVGFLMPKAESVVPIFHYYNPSIRRQEHPLVNPLYLHRMGRNLASAVRALHARGYVIGDVNETNILATDTALITLVDTDSFQVRSTQEGRLYRCRVGRLEFTPPELQGRVFIEADRLPEHDLFGLGVVLFQLLMEGTHPFSGVYLGTGEPPPYEARIQEGSFPYGTRRGAYRPMPVAPAFETLHPTLRQLFLRCFEDGFANPSARPDAQTWQNALAEAEADLIPCTKNEQHRYSKHLSLCPWCERTQLLKGRDPFPSQGAVRQGEHKQRIRRKPTVLPSQPYIPLPSSGTAPPNYAAWSSTGGSGQTVTLPTLPHNYWALVTLFLASVSLVPPLRFAAGLATLPTAVLAWRNARTVGGEGRGMAVAGAFLGVLMCLLSFVLRPPRGVLFEPGHGINALAFSPDGKRLAVATRKSEDVSHKGGTVNFWDVETEEMAGNVREYLPGDVAGVTFSPNGKYLALVSWGTLEPGHLTLVNEYGTPLWRKEAHRNEAQAVIFSPDGKTIVTGGCREFSRTKEVYSEVKFWDALTGKEGRLLEGKGEVFALAFSPDGRYLAVGCGSSGSGASFRSEEAGRVEVYDVSTGNLLWKQGAHGTAVLSVAFSPDGKSLATCGKSNTIRVWDTLTGQSKTTLSGEGNQVSGVVFHPNGQMLVSAGSDTKITLWDIKTGATVRQLTGQGQSIHTLALYAKGNVLASGSLDGRVHLWRDRL